VSCRSGLMRKDQLIPAWQEQEEITMARIRPLAFALVQLFFSACMLASTMHRLDESTRSNLRFCRQIF
jgi:hypothetical protein